MQSWKSKIPRIPELTRKDKTPSPDKYDGNDKLTSLRAQVPRIVLDKSPKESFLDKVIKDKKKVPGPCSYETESALAKVTIGARRGYK